MKLEKETTISHYKILSEIGKGGMGEVFLAQDTKLNRKVAIKFLSGKFSKDADKLKRFVQEAQAASALNHPNIITIYEIGEFEGAHYIATEYIEGSVLKKTGDNSSSLKFILETAIQIASALDAAHVAGIVHRDIKPDNVMIRPDGLVKILDFGIAKLLEKSESKGLGEEDQTLIAPSPPVTPSPKTMPGMVIGTANYMSPEQAKGQEVDKRTDIFSFGVLLYEMLAGHLPFAGETPMEVIAAIINKDPKPLTGADVPAEIKRVIEKALRKDRDERYQTIKGLLADLNEVRRELDFQDKLERTVEPATSDQQTQILQATTVGEQKQTTNVTAGRRGNGWKFGIWAVGLLAVLFIGGWYFLTGDLFSKEMPFAKFSTLELISGDGLYNPVLAPDGKLAAYTRLGEGDRKGKFLLVVRQIGSGAEDMIHQTATRGGAILVETFSPDGEYIYFLEQPAGGNPELYRIPNRGGTPRKILAGDITDVSISPDGKRIAYLKYGDSNTVAPAYIANIDGSNQQEILNIKDIDANIFVPGNWSPDGTKLSLMILREEKGSGDGIKEMRHLTAVFDLTDLKGDRRERLQIVHNGAWDVFDSPTWTPDGEGLIFIASRRESPQKIDIRYIAYPAGELRSITDDTNRYGQLSLSADGKNMITRTSVSLTSLWSVDPETKNVRQVKSENKMIDGYSLTRAEDGRLYFLKFKTTGFAVASMNEDGGDEKELFTGQRDVDQMTVSPDGKYVVLNMWSAETLSWELYRFNADGSNRVKLTELKDSGDFRPQVTVDGKIFFDRRDLSSDTSVLMKLPLEGGKAEKIGGLEPSDGDRRVKLSPDGKLLVYRATVKDKESGKSKFYIRVVEFADGKAGRKVLERAGEGVSRFRWTSNSDALIYEKDREQHNLFKLTLADGKETQISSFDLNTDSGNFVWTGDGKRILVFRSSAIDNLVLLKDISDD